MAAGLDVHLHPLVRHLSRIAGISRSRACREVLINISDHVVRFRSAQRWGKDGAASNLAGLYVYNGDYNDLYIMSNKLLPAFEPAPSQSRRKGLEMHICSRSVKMYCTVDILKKGL